MFARTSVRPTVVLNRMHPNRSLRMTAPPVISKSLEMLERRLLFAITSTTPTPISAIEGSLFSDQLAAFTADDAGPFTVALDWGDGSPAGTGVAAPNPNGGFIVSGSHTYAEDGPY